MVAKWSIHRDLAAVSARNGKKPTNSVEYMNRA